MRKIFVVLLLAAVAVALYFVATGTPPPQLKRTHHPSTFVVGSSAPTKLDGYTITATAPGELTLMPEAGSPRGRIVLQGYMPERRQFRLIEVCPREGDGKCRDQSGNSFMLKRAEEAANAAIAAGVIR